MNEIQQLLVKLQKEQARIDSQKRKLENERREFEEAQKRQKLELEERYREAEERKAQVEVGLKIRKAKLLERKKLIEAEKENFKNFVLKEVQVQFGSVPQDFAERILQRKAQTPSRILTEERFKDLVKLAKTTKSEPRLVGFDMRTLRLGGLNLEKVDFTSSNLSRMDLSYTNFSLASFKEADLSYCLLQKSNLSGANLSGANLSNVDLQGANLSGSNITVEQLMKAKDRNLSGVNLSGLNLQNADLSNFNLSNSKLSNCNLSSSNLSGCNISGANLTNSNLSKCKLSLATLMNASAEGVNFSESDVIATQLQTVKDRHLHRVNLTGVNFTEADLSHLDFTKATLANCNFFDANLSNTNFSDANLSKVDFSGATLTNCCLEGANVEGCIMRAPQVSAPKKKLTGYQKLSKSEIEIPFTSKPLEGICFFLGTNCGDEEWKNPLERKLMNITTSHEPYGNSILSDLVDPSCDRNVSIGGYSSHPPYAIVMDFENLSCLCTHVTLQGGKDSPSHTLYKWKVDGSNDYRTWTTLLSRDGVAFKTQCQVKTWEVTTTSFFRYFRIVQRHRNSSNGTWMSLRCKVYIFTDEKHLRSLANSKRGEWIFKHSKDKIPNHQLVFHIIKEQVKHLLTVNSYSPSFIYC